MAQSAEIAVKTGGAEGRLFWFLKALFKSSRRPSSEEDVLGQIIRDSHGQKFGRSVDVQREMQKAEQVATSRGEDLIEPRES